MPITPEEFRDRLTSSGLFSSAELDSLGEANPEFRQPADAQELAKLLVRKKRLTKFQAAVLYQGHAQPLVLGKYVILEKIGAGGMGQVFRARHRVMDRQVAIKVLPAKLVSSPNAIRRFHREVKAAAQLEHANIVAAYDADQEGKDDEAQQSLTQSGQIMGTAHYMSPEQALDTHNADARSGMSHRVLKLCGGSWVTLLLLGVIVRDCWRFVLLPILLHASSIRPCESAVGGLRKGPRS